MHKTTALALSVLAFATVNTTQAFAGAADMAEKHFNAIASGDVGALQKDYAENAVFQWVGGPLDGVYNGSSAISGLWSKFAKAQGKLDVDVMSVEESANPKGVTVNAAVTFTGKKPIPVRYILVYRGDKLVNEIWQIDPNLKTNKAY